MSLYDRMNARVLDVFGEAVTFTTSGGPVTLVGVVDRPGAPNSVRASEAAAANGAVFGPDDVLVTVRNADLADAGIAARNTATIDGHVYTVNGIWPDSGGMTALELRA